MGSKLQVFDTLAVQLDPQDVLEEADWEGRGYLRGEGTSGGGGAAHQELKNQDFFPNIC